MKGINKTSWLIVIMFLLTTYNISMGQQLVYHPINPAFGGNPMNYSWLMSSAQAQNLYKNNGPDLSPFNTNPLQDFTTTLQRQILSSLSQKIVSGQMGDMNITTKGSYDLGDYKVDINPGINGISVTIFDKITGQETNVSIPYL